MKFTASVLRHIKAIKLSAYEPRIAAIAIGMRKEEVAALVKWIMEILKVSIATNWLASFMSLVTVTAFTLVSLYSGTAGVTTARVFTVISTIELISWPLLNLGQKLGGLVTAWACLKRIEAFLLQEERQLPGSSPVGSGMELQEAPASGRILLQRATFGIREKVTLLRDLEINLQKPGLWMITGRVGCVSLKSYCS